MSERYIESGFMPPPGDSNLLVDGDTSFIGIDARTQPEKLQPGMVQSAMNMRFDLYTANVRKGMAKLTNAISASNTALIIPFIVGAGAIITDTVTDGVFGACIFSDQNANNHTYNVLATGIKAYLIDSGFNVAAINYPANEIIEMIDTVTLFQVGGNVYLLRGDAGVQFPTASLTSTSTTATFTSTGATGLATGMTVRIAGAAQSNYNGDFSITTASTSSFTYTMPGTATSPATGTIVANRIKLPMKWNGNQASSFTLVSHGVITENFSYMPASNFGLIQMNRAILEYTRNQIIISQILNVESYDTINGIFGFASGTTDYLIGLQPYQDNQLLVFNRYSIYLVNGIDGDVAAMSSQLLTAQVGCVAKRSIATCGANVLFLSDLGVFILQPGLELLLRGNSLPLSAQITSYIQQINFAATSAPTAIYFNNRYYLAVPLNGATRNNAILIYNFINQQWESVDTPPNGFYYDYMTVSLNAAGTPTLYVISFEGGIYAYEQNEMDDFAALTQSATKYLINGSVRTRRLTFGTNGLKRFNRVMTNFSLDANSGFATTAYITNPTESKTLPSLSTVNEMTVTRPYIVGKRGYGVEFVFSNTANRGTITNYSVGAYIKDMKSTGTS